MKRFLKQMALVACGAMMAMLLVMCGPPGMGMMGDAMVDVGMTLRDGSDTSMPDAMAQDCATDCTGGGVLRVMTADTDPDQLRHAGVYIALPPSGDAVEVVAGPIVITDLMVARENGISYELRMTSLPDCTGPIDPATTEHVVTLISAPQVGMTSVNTRFTREVHGGRILVPAGSRICTSVSNTGFIYYAGFVPYD